MDLSHFIKDDSCLPPPSAKVLPFMLQQKLIRQLQERNIPCKSKAVITTSLTSKRDDEYSSDHLYTTSELDDELHRVDIAIAASRQGIQAAEETYYEETATQGNIFNGWDGFIDSRDIVGSLSERNHHVVHASSNAAMRRMPMDHRWFSNSHVSRSTSRIHDNNDTELSSKYLKVTHLDDDGKAVTIMTEEESAAMDLQQTEASAATALPNDKQLTAETSNETEEGNQDMEESNEIDKTMVVDDMKTPDNKKGKRKAAPTPPVSTRPKRARK
jgi:hypothetical protein